MYCLDGCGTQMNALTDQDECILGKLQLLAVVAKYIAKHIMYMK